MDHRRLYTFVGVAGAAGFLSVSLQYVVPLLRASAVLPDFTVFWTAGRFAFEDPMRVYDTAALTEAQSWAVDPSKGPRPFPYPPTALFLVIPFALLSFWTAYWTWLALSAAFFWSAARRLRTGWSLPLWLATPHVVLVLILGQTTLILASLVIWSITLIRERPALAGVLLGVAAAVKPQSVLLAPVALISGGHRSSLVTFFVTVAGLCFVSLVFGTDIWREWLAALTTFPEDLERHRLHPLGATPWMAGRTLELSATALMGLQVGGVIAGICAVWFAFRTTDIHLRLTAFVLGGLLASPYAMRYELAALAPVFVTALLSGTFRGLLVSVPLFALNSLTILPAIVVSLSGQFLRVLRHQSDKPGS